MAHPSGEAQAIPAHRPSRMHPVRRLRRHLPVEMHPHALHQRHRRSRQRRPTRRRPQRPRLLRRRRRRLHPLRAVRRPLPHRRHRLGQGHRPMARRRPQRPHQPTRLRLRRPLLTAGKRRAGVHVATTNGNGNRPKLAERVAKVGDNTRSSQAWNAIFRPGSVFRKGYTDSPRNRSYVIMNNVLYHLHPVKVKRHAVKVSYTLCLGGLSFFLFILLTVTGIFLMFFYRPTSASAWNDIKTLETAVAFGSLVRNMHRWGAHLMVLSVFLHMCRVFYHGAYKSPREFNWVIGVILFTLTLLLSFTGYLLPWDQLALWAVTVGTNMMGYTPVFGSSVKYVLLGSKEISGSTLLLWYVLHVLLLPFVIVIFMAVHFWRVRKDGGLSGPL